MDKKTVGLIATIGTTVLCACPSIFLCVWGGLGVAQVPIDTTFNGQTASEPMSMGLGVALLCLAVIGLATPVVVGFFTLRKKPGDAATVGATDYQPIDPVDPISDDIIPPTS